MERTLYKELKIWKQQRSRLPLIVRGARQVGKSFLVEKFGRQEFSQLQVVNFEKKHELGNCFSSLEPKEILKQLELQTGVSLKVGKALLFLDEIQDCPQALKALRYFAEEMPQLHVIAAGSLLEFILEDSNFSFPVGRVQIVNIGPVTFSEYLKTLQEPALIEWINTIPFNKTVNETLHNRLIKLVREYFCIGGMPGVISSFKDTGSFLQAKRMQSAIFDLYALDFGKYATKHAEYRNLKKIFERAPNLVGKHFRFSKIDPDCANPARDYREALNRLQQARLLVSVYLTKGNSLPLRAEKNEKKFKIFLLDVGLLLFSLGWDALELDKDQSATLFQGIIAEQFVSQELIALQDPYIDRGLYYWENINQSSSAEIDFLINFQQRILPIEVKSGITGRLKSLRQFMEKNQVPIGIRISESPLDFSNNILSIPFYLIGQMPRLLKELPK